MTPSYTHAARACVRAKDLAACTRQDRSGRFSSSLLLTSKAVSPVRLTAASAPPDPRTATPRRLAYAGVGVFLLFSTAHAQDAHTIERSTVTLVPTTRQGVIAEVHFNNSDADAKHVTSTFPLSLGGLTIEVTATVGLSAPDTITVETPAGVVPVPRTLTIEDGKNGVVLLVPVKGVGS